MRSSMRCSLPFVLRGRPSPSRVLFNEGGAAWTSERTNGSFGPDLRVNPRVPDGRMRARWSARSNLAPTHGAGTELERAANCVEVRLDRRRDCVDRGLNGGAEA